MSSTLFKFADDGATFFVEQKGKYEKKAPNMSVSVWLQSDAGMAMQADIKRVLADSQNVEDTLARLTKNDYARFQLGLGPFYEATVDDDTQTILPLAAILRKDKIQVTEFQFKAVTYKGVPGKYPDGVKLQVDRLVLAMPTDAHDAPQRTISAMNID